MEFLLETIINFCIAPLLEGMVVYCADGHIRDCGIVQFVSVQAKSGSSDV